MAAIFFSIETTPLYTQPIDQLFDGQSARLDVSEVYMNSFLGLLSSTNVTVKVINNSTNKEIKSAYWDNTTSALVNRKKLEYKPSFFKRFGRILLFAFVAVAILVGALLVTIGDHKEAQQNAVENFNKAYGAQDKAVWLQALQPGDILLANENYSDPVQVFKIVEFTDQGVLVEAFDQFIPAGEYEESANLNSLVLGTGSSTQITISRPKLLDGLVYDLAVDMSSKQKYIQQIKKANK